VTSLEKQQKITEEDLIKLIDTYGNELLRLCTLYLKDKHLAEDALQETFVKVWQRYSTYNGLSSEKTCITYLVQL